MSLKKTTIAISFALLSATAFADNNTNTSGAIDAAFTTTNNYVNDGANLTPKAERDNLLSFFDDHLVISNTARIRVDSGDTDASYASVHHPKRKSYSHLNLETWITARIWQDWKIKAQFEPQLNLKTGKMNGDHDIPMNKLYAEGTIYGDWKTRVGKFGAFSSYGRVLDNEVTGLELFYDNKMLPTKLTIARMTKHFNDNPWGAEVRRKGIYALQTVLPLATDTELGATIAYADAVKRPNNKEKSALMGEIGVTHNFTPDWQAMAAYSHTNIDDYHDSANKKVANNGFFAALKYKQSNWTIPNSYDIFLNVRRIGAMSGVSSTEDYSKNVQGVQLGGNWVAYKNLKFNAFYLHGKQVNATVGNEKQDVRVVRAQVEYKF